MSYFIQIRTQSVVQESDRIRFDVSGSFGTRSEGQVTKVEIRPEAGEDFFDVFDQDQSRWFLDWVYAITEAGDIEAGFVDKVVSVRITTEDEMEQETVYEMDKTIRCVTEAADALFSSDSDLIAKEHDILSWLPAGFSSWNHVHRQAQKNILDWLDEIRLVKEDGSRWKPSELARRDQVRRFSVYIALRMIFGSISNQVGDVFDQKREQYAALESSARNRNYISLEPEGGQGRVDVDVRSMSLVRR